MQPEGDRLGGRRLLLLRSIMLQTAGGPECQGAAQHSEHGHASSMLSYLQFVARVRHPAHSTEVL